MIGDSWVLTPNRSSFEATKKLLERFVQSAVKTTSTFHEQKNGDNPSLSHAAGISDFESAKKVLDNDLSRVLSLGRVEEGDICSVHFSDISGLSRLEINICVHEVSAYFGENNITWSHSLLTISKKRKTSPYLSLNLQSSTANLKRAAGRFRRVRSPMSIW